MYAILLISVGALPQSTLPRQPVTPQCSLPPLAAVDPFAQAPLRTKACSCSPACTCGCNEGKPCTCGSPAAASGPQYGPVSFVPQNTYAGFSFGGNCGPGG